MQRALGSLAFLAFLVPAVAAAKDATVEHIEAAGARFPYVQPATVSRFSSFTAPGPITAPGSRSASPLPRLGGGTRYAHAQITIATFRLLAPCHQDSLLIPPILPARRRLDRGRLPASVAPLS